VALVLRWWLAGWTRALYRRSCALSVASPVVKERVSVLSARNRWGTLALTPVGAELELELTLVSAVAESGSKTDFHRAH
jgi:hypothetical protein